MKRENAKEEKRLGGAAGAQELTGRAAEQKYPEKSVPSQGDLAEIREKTSAAFAGADGAVLPDKENPASGVNAEPDKESSAPDGNAEPDKESSAPDGNGAAFNKENIAHGKENIAKDKENDAEGGGRLPSGGENILPGHEDRPAAEENAAHPYDIGPRLSRGRRAALAAAHIAKSSVVLIVALVAAAITCFFVPFDREYLGYFDLQTLSCLFCTLAVVAAFKNIRFFVWLADIIVRRFKNMRNIVLALVFVTYFGSMIMANDMALITFLPLGYFVLDSCGNKKLTAFTFIMQNIAANLGGMLTPFGNPQNLYLYSYFQIGAGEFFKIMALPLAVAFLLILGVCLFVRPEKASLVAAPRSAPPVWRIAAYTALFALSVLIVFRVFPYYWGLLAVTAALLLLDHRSILHVDYGLLLTFCAFFVFSGNMARIPAVEEFLGGLVSRDPLAFGTLTCQIISNVPSAVLLSKFTADYAGLLVAVNIGGLGTPIASLASLITLNTYRRVCPGDTKRYICKYLAFNFSFLAVLIGVGYLNALIL